MGRGLPRGARGARWPVWPDTAAAMCEPVCERLSLHLAQQEGHAAGEVRPGRCRSGAERRRICGEERARPGGEGGGGCLAGARSVGPGPREGAAPVAARGFQEGRRAGMVLALALVCSILVCIEGGRDSAFARAPGRAHTRLPGPTRLRGGGDDDPIKAARAGTRECASPSPGRPSYLTDIRPCC